MTRQAALAGKHVHCEKPFCRSVAEGMEAVQAVKSAGVKLLVGETYLFLTSHMKARALIEDGAIGRPLQIRQRHGAWRRRANHKLRLSAAARDWRLDGAQSDARWRRPARPRKEGRFGSPRWMRILPPTQKARSERCPRKCELGLNQ
ncbi:MAG: Gfo/Idh/MocA family oxidoreductase [Caldilineaceae bacterium SB0665_bin_25]|nr:Gfo/Idh/MocA family oxidoreductase [Caldilineaceae bacterium SB0665_bin_25]